MNSRKAISIGVAMLLLVLCAADMATGTASPDRDILLYLRLPRMLTALLAGAALSLAGLQMQGVFRNPLSDPHIMGISAGAGLAVAIVVVCGVGTMVTMPLAAFVGAGLVSLLVVAVSSKVRRSETLLILGVMIGFILSAITSIMEYSASEQSLKVFYNWSAGTFVGNTLQNASVMAVVLVIGVVLAAINARGLDKAAFGHDYVVLTGGSPRQIRLLSMVSCCLLAGCTTAFCGPIGFVGIVAPHISRRLLHTSVHGRLIPMSMAVGACIALCADILSQVFGKVLPVGSMMALLGIPVILVMMLRKDKEF